MLATFCANLIKFGPATPEIMRWQIVTLGQYTKIGISHRIGL